MGPESPSQITIMTLEPLLVRGKKSRYVQIHCQWEVGTGQPVSLRPGPGHGSGRPRAGPAAPGAQITSAAQPGHGDSDSHRDKA